MILINYKYELTVMYANYKMLRLLFNYRQVLKQNKANKSKSFNWKEISSERRMLIIYFSKSESIRKIYTFFGKTSLKFNLQKKYKFYLKIGKQINIKLLAIYISFFKFALLFFKRKLKGKILILLLHHSLYL